MILRLEGLSQEGVNEVLSTRQRKVQEPTLRAKLNVNTVEGEKKGKDSWRIVLIN